MVQASRRDFWSFVDLPKAEALGYFRGIPSGLKMQASEF
jgi:hypothetical protein